MNTGTGVSKHGNSWRARIMIGGKYHHLGMFPFCDKGKLKALEAVKAFKEKRKTKAA